MTPPANNQGFIILMATVVISAIGVAIATSLLLLGIGSSRSSLILEQSAQAKSLANACAEYALNQLRLDENYAGNETVSISGQNCFVETVGGTGQTNRTIRSRATAGEATRRVRVTGIDITSAPVIARWEEVADY